MSRPALAAAGLLLAAAGLGWVETPLQGTLRGYALPLGGSLTLARALHNPAAALSYGTAAALLAGVAALVSRRGFRATLLAGLLALGLAAWFVTDLVVRREEVVQAAADQHSERLDIKKFDAAYLEGNFAEVPGAEDVVVESALDRLAVALSLAGAGWYATVAAGLLLAGGAFRRRPTGRDLAFAAAALAAVAAALLAPAAADLRAEYWRGAGSARAARGQYGRALEAYRRAGRADPVLARNPRYVHRVGAALSALGDRGSPETQVYLGDTYLATRNVEEAVHRYRQALALEPGDPVVRGQLARALADKGRLDYAAGRVDAAVAGSDQAAGLEPRLLQPRVFVPEAHQRMDGRVQGRPIAEDQLALSLTRDQLLRSDLYNRLGRAHYRQRDYVTGREMFARSLNEYHFVKRIINFQAERGLQGR